jgi:hypothetical protein
VVREPQEGETAQRAVAYDVELERGGCNSNGRHGSYEVQARERAASAEATFREQMLRHQADMLELQRGARAGRDSVAYRLKQYGDAIRNALPKMNDNPLEVLSFLNQAETCLMILAYRLS